MFEDITTEEIINILKRTNKWKSLTIDKIAKIWLDHLSFTYKLMTKLISETISKTWKFSDWLTERVTYLLSKTKLTTNKQKKNYRPIICLHTIYKMIKQILKERTCKIIECQAIVSLEHKGYKKESYGCIDQLLINTEKCRFKQKIQVCNELTTKKVFDSMPYKLISNFKIC